MTPCRLYRLAAKLPLSMSDHPAQAVDAEMRR